MSDFAAEFARCAPWLQEALARSREAMTLADVEAMIRRDHAQFWPFNDAAIVTVIRQEPHRKVISFWLAGGALETLRRAEPKISRWARETQGCSAAEIVGRPGWERALDGYAKAAVILHKELQT